MSGPLPSEAPRPTSGDLRCPRWGGPLTSGFLTVAGRVNWVDHEGLFDAAVWKGETIVGTLDVAFTTAGHLPARRCATCAIVVFQY